MDKITSNNQILLHLIDLWIKKLSLLPNTIVTNRLNNQNRSIKQIIGHMIDSASNNTHRIIHLQYQANPLVFPDYANHGDNDRWIQIQNFQNENWEDLIQLWKYSNLHIVHVIQNVNPDKFNNEWITALNTKVTLKDMIIDYLSHFKLHLSEIENLINQ